MCTYTQLHQVTNQMAQCYHDIYGADIVGIFLYGSYARGDYDNQSDIDIAAIVKGSRLDLQNKLKAVWDISADIGLENDVVVSPTVIPYDEFEEYMDQHHDQNGFDAWHCDMFCLLPFGCTVHNCRFIQRRINSGDRCQVDDHSISHAFPDP